LSSVTVRILASRRGRIVYPTVAPPFINGWTAQQ
jgi:hypothetical protein